MGEAGAKHTEKQGNRILEKFCIAIENISGCWLVMTSNALNQAQNHGAWKVLVNCSLNIFTHFISHFFKGLYVEKPILLIQNFIRTQRWDICKHLPSLQWMELQQMNVNIALIVCLCRLHSTKGHSKLMSLDWSFRRCRGHSLSLFRGLDFNRTKSMWSKWALVWRWTEATSFCSGRKSRCSKNQASYLNVASTIVEDGNAEEQSCCSRCGALRNRVCRYDRRCNINVESSKEYVEFNSNYSKLTRNISTSEKVLTWRTASTASHPPKIPPNSLTSVGSGTTRLPWASLVIQNCSWGRDFVKSTSISPNCMRHRSRGMLEGLIGWKWGRLFSMLWEKAPSDAFITRKLSKVNVK